MEYGILDFLQLIGSLGLFIYGMKLMSEALQKVAGSGLRNILKGMTSSRVAGIFTGILATAMVQSSSATTVMVVSFVNAGLLSLTESVGVIMGANIGTTVTGWLISILGFKVKITSVAIVLIGVAFPLLFSNKSKWRSLAEFILGFGILFIGLDFLKDSVPDIKSNPEILEFLKPLANSGFLSILLFVSIGTVLTVVIQSSSATMAVTLVMLAQGWITFDIAAAMVLGENIGTTITANLAALVGNVHAKRAARFHFIFNIFGVIWMLIVMKWYIQGIDMLQIKLTSNSLSVFTDSDAARENATLALSLFHTTFNILNVLILYAFVPFLVKVVIRIQPTRSDEDEEHRLQFISTGLLATPAMSLANAKKELELFAKLVDKMVNSISALLFEKQKNPNRIINKIQKREEITDELEVELADYLAKLSESGVSLETSKSVNAMLSMGNDLERVADLVFEMSKNYERLRDSGGKLNEKAKTELKGMIKLLIAATKLMRSNMGKESKLIDIKEVYDLEYEINQKAIEIKEVHLKRLEKQVYDPKLGVLFLDFINRSEKAADHLVNVSEALAGLK